MRVMLNGSVIRLYSSGSLMTIYGVMNLPVIGTGGSIMAISQFTLHAKTKKGNRPSYIRAAHPEIAVPLYESFVSRLSGLLGKEVAPESLVQ